MATSGSASGAGDDLLASAIVVPVLSKRTLQPFASLHAGSSCDNLLLEMLLAVTLEEREQLAFIMPLLVGSVTDDLGHGLGVGFRDFFKEGAVPQLSDVLVTSVESMASALLERYGMPRLDGVVCGAKTALDGILAHQGVFLRGIQADAMSTAIDRLIAKAFQLAPDQTSARGSNYLSTESARCSSGDDAESGRETVGVKVLRADKGHSFLVLSADEGQRRLGFRGFRVEGLAFIGTFRAN